MEVTVIQVINYSEKSFALVGNTKPKRQLLKQLGGRFNPKLRCGAGWIFSLKRKDDVLKKLGLTC